jgi:hypothetical protein
VWPKQESLFRAQFGETQRLWDKSVPMCKRKASRVRFVGPPPLSMQEMAWKGPIPEMYGILSGCVSKSVKY